MNLAEIIKAMPVAMTLRLSGGAVTCTQCKGGNKHAHHAIPTGVPVGMGATIKIGGVVVQQG